jgi:outer membrane biosynthesis protein TonB
MDITRSALTSRDAKAVLEDLERRADDEGLVIRDRAHSYLNVGTQRAIRGGAGAAIASGVVILLLVLGLTAVSPLFIVLLPVALAPAIPFVFLGGDAVTVAVFPTGQRVLVTADGKGSELTGRVVQEFFGALPQPVAETSVQETAIETSTRTETPAPMPPGYRPPPAYPSSSQLPAPPPPPPPLADVPAPPKKKRKPKAETEPAVEPETEPENAADEAPTASLSDEADNSDNDAL